jgi:hypothetical protein
LKYIVVCDLQTLEKSYFICQRWFAVEKDGGRVRHFLSSSSISNALLQNLDRTCFISEG